MKSLPDFAITIAACAAAGALVWSTSRWWAASRDVETARTADLQAAAIISEVRHLRTLPIIVEDGQTREDRLLGMVSDSLVQAGINPSVIKDVSSESVSAGAGVYHRQTIRVQFESISIPDLGRFLASWKKQHPTWIATTLNVAPMKRAVSGGKSSETSVAWSVSIFFTSSFLGSSALPLSPPQHPPEKLPR
ncbi:MAG: hypothetical protein JNK16_00885 [Phycisphaerales bacterium]|nr:hypothetical protein [Phycisphaerales bacterium]